MSRRRRSHLAPLVPSLAKAQPPALARALVILTVLAALATLSSAAPFRFGSFGGDQLPQPFYREIGQFGSSFGPLRPPPPPVFYPTDNQPGFYHHFISHRW